MRRNGPLALLFHTIFVIVMVAPILVVCLVAFTPEGFLSLPTNGFSLRWFRAIANYPEFIHAFWVSLGLGALSSFVALLFAVPAALAIARYRFRGREAMTALFMSPLILPALAFGLASLIYFSRLNINLSLATLVIGHSVVGVPYVMRTTIAALSQLPPALLESSASLGASRAYTFRRVTLPLIAPGIAAGAFIAFMSSFDNVPVSLFLRDASTDMLPIRMWQDLEGKLDVSIAAVSSLMVLGTLILMIVMERLTGISKRIR